jgi:hypothetical protein
MGYILSHHPQTRRPRWSSRVKGVQRCTGESHRYAL